MIGLVLHLLKFMVYYGFSPGFIFSYLSTGQEIGWKERLRYDLYCVEWDEKPQLNQLRTSLLICFFKNKPVSCAIQKSYKTTKAGFSFLS